MKSENMTYLYSEFIRASNKKCTSNVSAATQATRPQGIKAHWDRPPWSPGNVCPDL